MESTKLILDLNNHMTEDCSSDYKFPQSRDASKQCFCSKCSQSNVCSNNCCWACHAKLASACTLPISQSVSAEEQANSDADARCSQSVVENSIEYDGLNPLESNDTVSEVVGSLPCYKLKLMMCCLVIVIIMTHLNSNNKIKSKNLKDLFIIHINIRSLQKNLDALHTVLFCLIFAKCLTLSL